MYRYFPVGACVQWASIECFRWRERSSFAPMRTRRSQPCVCSSDGADSLHTPRLIVQCPYMPVCVYCAWLLCVKATVCCSLFLRGTQRFFALKNIELGRPRPVFMTNTPRIHVVLCVLILRAAHMIGRALCQNTHHRSIATNTKTARNLPGGTLALQSWQARAHWCLHMLPPCRRLPPRQQLLWPLPSTLHA